MNYNLFKKDFDEKRISNSYIFEGDKNFLNEAREYFIKSLLNEENDVAILKKIKENTHPDLMILNREKSNIPIAEIRKMIDYVQKKPIYSRYKVVCINDAEFLGVESSNALLKTLEESFEYVVIAFFTESRYKLLNTIQSRCIFVTQSENFEKSNITEYEELLNIVNMALKGDFMAIYSSKNREYLLSLKEDLKFLDVLYDFFKDFYLYLDFGFNDFDKMILKIYEENRNFNSKKIDKILQSIENVKRNLKNNVNFQLSVENIFINILKKILNWGALCIVYQIFYPLLWG